MECVKAFDWLLLLLLFAMNCKVGGTDVLGSYSLNIIEALLVESLKRIAENKKLIQNLDRFVKRIAFVFFVLSALFVVLF